MSFNCSDLGSMHYWDCFSFFGFIIYYIGNSLDF